MRWLPCCLGAILAASLFVSCGGVQDDTSGTGAKECVQVFYQALIRQDWAGAYQTLDLRSQKAHPIEQFCRLAQNYRRSLGFEPEAIHIQACQEHGPEAIAHVILMGRNAGPARRYKDAATLRRSNEGWRIVLSPTFGQTKK